jgi:hypothetical protein
MKLSIKNTITIILCSLLLLGASSCFKLVTGGNVDKEWPRNNSKNPHHSTTSIPEKTDSIKVELPN